MSIILDKEGQAKIRFIISVFLVLSGTVAALLIFSPVPTRTEQVETSGEITFLDGSGNLLTGTVKITGSGVPGGSAVSSGLKWEGVPNAAIYFNALDSKNISINLWIAGNSPDGTVVLENYGVMMPGSVNVSAPGVPVKYVQIGASNVSFAEADISIQYTDAEMEGLSERNLALYHYDGANSTWDELPTTIDETNKSLRTTVNSLSVFAVSAARANEEIEIRDTRKMPVISDIKTYNETRPILRIENSSALLPADIPDRGELEVDAIKTKNVAVRLKVNKPDNGQIILDDHGLKNPTSLPLPGRAVKFVDIGASNISFSSANITIRYNESELNGGNENDLIIYHWNGAAWDALPTIIDTTNKTLTATTTSLSPFGVATNVTYYLENNATVRSVGADGNTNYNASGATITVIPYKNLLKNGTMGTQSNIRYTTVSTAQVEVFRFYIPFNYTADTRISANTTGRIVWRAVNSSDTVNISLISYNPKNGSKTVIGSRQFTATGGGTTTNYPFTIPNPQYTVPAGNRLMLRINTTTPTRGTVRLYFNDLSSYVNIIETALDGAAYNLSGYVTDKSSGSPLSGATVQTNTSLTTTTNATGFYNFTNLSNGTYIVNASFAGYATNSTTVIINGADVTRVNISLLSLSPLSMPPPAPINLASNQGNFWINYTWQPGAGNKTDSFNVSVNGSWTNGTTSTYSNNTVGAHNWSNITVWAYNNSGRGSLSLTSVSNNTRVANNAPAQVQIGNKAATAGTWLNFTVSATDADSDIITYGTNATKGTLNPTTGAYSWLPGSGDSGTYIWYFNSSDSYGGVAGETITVTVTPPSSYVPPAPANIASTQGNFWVNYTWQPGAGNKTDSYNVSVNRIWTNGSMNTYSNTTVGAHNWSNITVWAYNKSGSGSLSLTSISGNTQVANNVPVQAPIGNKAVTAGSWLNFTVSATDADSDVITYGTNATRGTLNPITGTYTWLPGSSDSGTYIWYFNSSDSYGGVASETITVTVISPSSYAPPAPANIASTQGNFWINYTWQAGAGNKTDSYNISVNGTWTNGTTNTYSNTTLGAHNWSNITIWAYNGSGGGSLSPSAVSQNTQVANNAPVQTPIGNKAVAAGNLLTFTVTAVDADSDVITYGTNATKGTLNPATGVYSWTPSGSDAGTYIWHFNSSDGYGGVAGETIVVTVTVNPPSSYIPPAPMNLTSAQGNFWINHTWQPGAGNATDSYNISVNGAWINGTTSTYYNNTVGAHNWSNITVWAYNNSGSGSLSITSVSNNTRVANNVPVQAPIGNKAVTAGNLLTFTVTATDADSDVITYGSNATKGTLNPATGVYSWTPADSDAGTYIWHFNSSDGYGGVAEETITMTVTINPPSSYIPPTPMNLISTQGNFWVNYIWQAGAGNKTDSYNISVNGAWINGTGNAYFNSTVGAHNWSNITVWAYNNSGNGSLSLTSVSNNTRVANNIPIQIPVGNKTVLAGSWLNFTVSATDADSDIITYSTNATKGTLNPATGAFSWLPGSSDAGTYIWYFSSSDNFGGVASETITINVTVNPDSVYAPPEPINLTSTQGNFWINYTWQPGTGNKTNSYNVSINGSWNNGTTAMYSNNTVGAHNWSNITIWAYNNSGNGSLSLTSISNNTQVANNIPIQTPIGNKAVTAGSWLNFTVSAIDVDSDVITYGSNATKGTLNPATGLYSWTPTSSDAGTYIWYFNSSDNYGGVATETITVTVNPPSAYTPPVPVNLTSTQGNFWINYTWQAGAGNKTDSYNISVNGAWTNGTTTTYSNTTVGAHNWSNITVWAYNNSGNGSLSLTPVSQNTRLANNIPVQAPIGNKTVAWDNILTFTVSTTDADSDVITYGTNATKGNLSATGIYSWAPSSGDIGTYIWYFNSSDGYGGVANETIVVTVTPSVADSVIYYLENNQTIQSVGADGNTNYNTSGSIITLIPYRNIMKNGTMGTQANISYATAAAAQVEVFRFYLPFNYTAYTQLSVNTSGRIMWKAAGSSDNVSVSLIDYNPKNGAKTIIGSTQFTATGGGTPTIYPFTIPNPQYTISPGNRLVFQVSTTTPAAGTVGLYFNDMLSYTNVTRVSLAGAGGPDCLSCHDYGRTGASHRINNTAMNSSSAIHTNLNRNATNSTWVPAENKKCWGCHTYNGSQPANDSMGDRYSDPYKCYDCHNATSKPYASVSNALNVSEHFLNGTDIKAAINVTDNSSSCIVCHNLTEMKVTYTEDDTYNSNYSLASHYGRSRAPDAQIRQGTGTNCIYCHRNSSTPFVAAMADSGNSNISNHSLRYNSSNPDCTSSQCHNSGWLHNSTLTRPNLTLPNSTFCLSCHGNNGSGGTNYTGAVTGIKAKHNNSVNCTECHLNSSKAIHPVKYLQSDASYSTVNSTGVNCIACHQNSTVYPNISKTPPKIPSPMHHSDNISNGTRWNQAGYWTPGLPITSCIYCHNDTRHNESALGRPENWKGNNMVNSSITNTSNWCAGCHYQGYSSGGKNYNSMTSAFISAALQVPPEITNGTYAPNTIAGYLNHTLTPDYNDSTCKSCHGISLSANEKMDAFVHNLTSRDCKGCHFSYSIMNSSNAPTMYVNQSMYNASPHGSLACEDCHTRGHKNIAARKSCEDCHAYQQNPITDKDRHNITASPGISVVKNKDCTTCHDAALYNNATAYYGLPPKINCDYCHTYPDKTYS